MSPDDRPVRLCHLQFGGEALRPDGLLGVVMTSFVLLAEKLADEFLGAFRNIRERRALRVRRIGGRRSVITAQEVKKLEIEIEQKYVDRRRKKESYS